tara:strand:+ start:145 stop:405 length:261 start_codon:yes stop_codon:yes gene_type:complete
MSEEITNDIFEGLLPPDRLKGVNMDNCLWQYIEKEHMEVNCNLEVGSINEDEWHEFVLRFQDSFANYISELAVEYWENRKQWSDDE